MMAKLMRNKIKAGKFRFRINLNTMFISTFTTDWINNLIVDTGRTWILNAIADTIEGLAVGTGTAEALLSDTALGNETLRKTVIHTINEAPDWSITFTASFTANEINGVTEIGLITDDQSGGVLITRSVFSSISLPPSSNITIEYPLELATSVEIGGWTLTQGQTATYQVSQPVPVVAVDEMDTSNGYVKKTSVVQVEATPCSWYWDDLSNILYVHTSDSTDPDTHTIYVTLGD